MTTLPSVTIQRDRSGFWYLVEPFDSLTNTATWRRYEDAVERVRDIAGVSLADAADHVAATYVAYVQARRFKSEPVA